MALPQGDFSRLLRELRGAGPVDRLRLLGRSLGALRGLSPWDRKVLLRMAGFEGAETLVERLAGEDRETARALNRVLAELEEDPDRLNRTVRNLGDPKRRGEAVDELLATLDRATAEEAAAAAAPVPAAATGAPEPGPSAAGPWQDPLAAAQAPTGGPPPQAAVPRRSAVPAPSGTPPRPKSAAAKAPPTAAAPPTRPAPEPEPAAPRPPARPAPAPEPAPEPVAPVQPVAAVPEPPSPRRHTPQPQPAEPLEPALPPEVPSAANALESLLQLRRRLDAGRVPSAAELLRLLERDLPFPWARRRAIQAWLATGAGHDLDEVLGLIDTLPPGSDRTWCLATLAASRPWPDGAWRHIVNAAASPSTRRQLELRRRRS